MEWPELFLWYGTAAGCTAWICYTDIRRCWIADAPVLALAVGNGAASYAGLVRPFWPVSLGVAALFLLLYGLWPGSIGSGDIKLALALAPAVRVVGVAPGLTLTSHMLSQEKFEALHTMSPLGRSSSPEDIAAAVCFALENRAMTGTTLLVDGGQHLQRFERDFSMM